MFTKWLEEAFVVAILKKTESFVKLVSVSTQRQVNTLMKGLAVQSGG